MALTKPFLQSLQHVFIALLMLVPIAGCDDDDDSRSEPKAEPITESGLYTLTSGGMEREYYVSLPGRQSIANFPPQLLIALHGAGDSYAGWLEGGFQGDGLQKLAAQSGSIMVMPNARMNAQGRRVWDPGTETDYDFFLDLLAELDQRITYDDQQVFLTGHSAGALMAHEYACRFGDMIRATAPSAGSITSSITPRCVGSVAVMQIQSEFDDIVPPTVVTDTRDLWALYNGFELGLTIAGETEPCVDYSLGVSPYPVQWCLHGTTESDGHGWWADADQAMWGFFTGLPVVESTTEPPDGGGNDRLTVVFPTTMTFTVDFPATIGPVVLTGLFLYPEGAQLPISGAPLNILNGGIDLGDVVPGTQKTYTVDVKLPPEDVLPNSYTLVLAVYVEGGSTPIPTPGIDHNVIYELTVNDSSTPITIPDVLYLEAVMP